MRAIVIDLKQVLKGLGKPFSCDAIPLMMYKNLGTTQNVLPIQ